MNWIFFVKPKIDKFATGGIGDKTALVLVPLAMAAGVVVPMMCSVEHDYVINTLDKLASIPGFKGNLTNEQFVSQLARINGAIIAQSKELAPADAKLYELRKETGTIPSLPLITGSVLSKKLGRVFSVSGFASGPASSRSESGVRKSA